MSNVKTPTVPELAQVPSKRQHLEVKSAGGQSIPQDVWTTIVYEIIDTNINVNYNSSTGIFTAGAKGLYSFSANAVQVFTASGNFTMYSRVLINGTKHYGIPQSENPSSTNFSWSRPISTTLFLEEGDTVEFQLFNNLGTFNTGNTSTYNWLTITELERLS